MTTFHIDASGKIIRATADPNAVIAGAVDKTDTPPPTGGRDTWNGSAWIPAPPIPPEATPTTIDDLARALVAKGLISQTDIDNAKKNR